MAMGRVWRRLASEMFQPDVALLLSRQSKASTLEAARALLVMGALLFVEDPAAGGAGLEALITRLRTATRSPGP